MSDYKAPTVGQTPAGEIRARQSLAGRYTFQSREVAAQPGPRGSPTVLLWRQVVGWPGGAEVPGPLSSQPGKEEARQPQPPTPARQKEKGGDLLRKLKGAWPTEGLRPGVPLQLGLQSLFSAGPS